MGQQAKTSPPWGFLQTMLFLFYKGYRFIFCLSAFWMLLILADKGKIREKNRKNFGIRNNVNFVYKAQKKTNTYDYGM